MLTPSHFHCVTLTGMEEQNERICQMLKHDFALCFRIRVLPHRQGNMKLQKNVVRLADNLPLLRDRALFPTECIDLIYCDPPLNPHRGTHTSAREIDTSPAGPLIPMPVNIWKWDDEANQRFEEILHTGPDRLRPVITALSVMLGRSAMFAYLVHMTARFIELHRVLKRTGSMFVHCDPIAAHYVKIILDVLFGQRGLVNQIVWKRVGDKEVPNTAHNMPRTHDIILYFRKSDKSTFNVQRVLVSDEYMQHFYPNIDTATGRRYRLGDVTSLKMPTFPQYEWRIKRHGENDTWKADVTQEWRIPVPGWEYKLIAPPRGKYWALPRDIMERMDTEGMMVYARTGYPHVKRFASAQGTPVQDIWTDIPPATGQDRIYLTQKPRLLLERIIAMASNPGDVILDPFCGSGPTMDAIENLNRQNHGEEPRSWIAIDVSYLAATLIKTRLGRYRNPSVRCKVIGDIKDVRAAEMLAMRDPLEFQYWAFGLVGARPWGGEKVRKTAERNVDGVRLFQDGTSPVLRPILVQVKVGNVKLDDIRGLEAFRRRTKSPLGLYISLQDPTHDAMQEVAATGTYLCPATKQEYPRIQLVTIEQLLNAKPGAPPLHLPPRTEAEQIK